jgi:DNA modification methylase
MSVTLLHGDCLDLLPTLPDASVDALVTDPPFGIGFEYNGGREVAATPAAYWAWFRPMYEAALRCVKPGGLVAVWQAQLNFRYFWEWFGPDIHIYCAAKNFVQLRKTAINYGYDPVVMFYKPGAPPLRPAKPPRSIDFFVANTAAVVSDTTRIEKAHPCPRPLDAVREIVRNFTPLGATVLDSFMGSGTTGVACLETDRTFIGIEQDADYYRIACERIAAAQPPLLDVA